MQIDQVGEARQHNDEPGWLNFLNGGRQFIAAYLRRSAVEVITVRATRLAAGRTAARAGPASVGRCHDGVFNCPTFTASW